MIDFIDKTATQNGTDINRAALMGIQGFIAQKTVFNSDGSITQTNSLGHTLITTFMKNGSIKETFTGEKTITKTITFNSDGSITEALS